MRIVEQPIEDVGIIVGRFQVHELHAAHLDLISTVVTKHPRVIVFLGVSPCLLTRYNPLDFESRKQMLLSAFPGITVLYVKDVRENAAWSADLDRKIGDVVNPLQSVVLYGGRDSFIRSYSGRYPTKELVPEVFVSGDAIRSGLSKCVKNTPEFRAGVIWAAYNQFPKVYPAVDIALFQEGLKNILLGRKPSETKYRFIGGFADPGSASYEEDAKREVNEEAFDGEISEPVYVGSFDARDWRYQHDVDTIRTILFASQVVFGTPRPADDICEVRWFPFNRFDYKTRLVEGHIPLWEKLMSFMVGKTSL
jgi:bifunctional NMN adenylyltransferase/nudix hydrolase